jgi:hypothetical protein
MRLLCGTIKSMLLEDKPQERWGEMCAEVMEVTWNEPPMHFSDQFLSVAFLISEVVGCLGFRPRFHQVDVFFFQKY